MIKKTTTFIGLNELPVLIYDTSETSPRYFNFAFIPDELTSGKNILKIKGNLDNLEVGSELFFEALDSNRNPIYYQFSNFSDESGCRLIVLYIYDDTPPGDVELTILGTAKRGSSGNILSKQQKQSPNVKWTKKIPLNPDKRNNTEIIFSPNNLPTIQIHELVRPYLDRRFGQGEQVNLSTGYIKYRLVNRIPTLISQGFNFVKSMEGADITIYPTGSIPELPSNIIPDSTSFQTTIKKVLTNSEAITDGRYIIPISLYAQRTWIPTSFENSNYTMSFYPPPTYSLTENSRSFAYVELRNLEPVCGTIERIKTFIKSNGSVGAWELVDDSVINESDYQEILIDTGSIDVKTPIGILTGTASIQNYWKGEIYRQYNNSLVQLASPELITIPSNRVFLTYQTGSYLPNSMLITVASQSYYPREFVKISNSGSRGEFDNHYNGGSQYKLTFDAIARPYDLLGKGIDLASGLTSSIQPSISIFMSGSAFDYQKTDSVFGKKILDINISDLIGNKPFTSIYRFDDKTIDFVADKTGRGVLVFRINSGKWNLGNISIKPLSTLGYNACQATFLIPLPTNHINDKLDFKFEYYDYQNNQSKILSTETNKTFAGGNTYIGGGYNLLTGSLFVGDGLRRGVEIQGIDGGLVRSIGYKGYKSASRGLAPGGFLIWSGSVLPTSGDSYNGVGLELHGGSGSAPNGRTHALRFKTDTGKLEITGSIVSTDAIFENFVLSDYIGYKIVNIDNVSKRNSYFKNYKYNSHSWSYLDLSSETTESGMFVFINTPPRYPVTHIRIPTVPDFRDNEIGGQVSIQFSKNSTTASATYFFDLGESKYSSSLYSMPSGIVNLTSSNAIRNLSGSFVYGGFAYKHNIGTPTMRYTGSLRGRTNSIYVLSKGVHGFGITSATNYDRTSFSALEGRIYNLKGTKRNEWVPAINVRYVPSGSVYASNEQMDLLDGYGLYVGSGSSMNGHFYCNVFIPEYIAKSKVKVKHYFYISQSMEHITRIRTHTTMSFYGSEEDESSPTLTFYKYRPSTFIKDTSGVRIINTTSTYASQSVFATIHDIENSNLQSAQVLNIKMHVSSSKPLNLNNGPILYLGTKVLFDSGSNIGGYDSADFGSYGRSIGSPTE